MGEKQVYEQRQGEFATRSNPTYRVLLQRACACGNHAPGGGECAACKRKRLQRSAAGPTPDVAPPIVHEVLRSPGQPLDTATRAFMEPRFGQDFSRVPTHTPQRSAELPIGAPGDCYECEAESAANAAVSAGLAGGMHRDFSHIRIHTDARAAESARAVGARAYTVGRHIVFGAGAYAPQTTAGRHLLAHELAHTVQQGGVRGALQALRLQRQSEGEAEPQLTRAEEIALSRSSPGAFTGEEQPLALSLYNFGIDVAELKPEHQAVLTELGQFLRTTTSVRTIIRSIGFADSSGDAQYNLALSRRRAVAAKTFLDPLIPQRISLSAYGETNPAATNAMVSGRSRNRRVDIRFFMDRSPTQQPLPIPSPVPPGTQPPGTQPPGTQPPGTQPPGGDDHRTFCADYPLLCGIGITPFLLPLTCLVAPEICLSVTCALAPELCLVPPPPSPPERPPRRPDDPEQPSVFFMPLVRAQNTPADMNDRIGLRDPVTVLAVVLNQPPSSAPIMIFVSGTGRQGGEATINGQAQINITSTTSLTIQGTAMTTHGFAFSPFLQLGAWWGNTLVGSSNRFAVSSIAEDWFTTKSGAGRKRYGYAFDADMDWVSDSGSYRHLDACAYVELVGVDTQDGGMRGMGIGDVNDPDDLATADLHPARDGHGTPFEYTQVAGYSLLKQLWRIRDLRSNSGWAPSRNSGFTIERRFERDPGNPRCWHLVVRKKGERVTIDGMTADAGSGDINHEFRNINCDPPPPPPPGRDDLPPPPPPPGHDIPPTTSSCDQEELTRRVNQCIEEAKLGVIACTAETAIGLVISGGGWGGVASQIEYLICLQDVREALLQCDRRAKADTNCPDVRVAVVEQEIRRLESEG